MMVPIDITRILTAAAPIVASIASIANKNKPEVIVEKGEDKKEQPANNISINITNNFYTNSEEESVIAATKINQDIVDKITTSKTHYII